MSRKRNAVSITKAKKFADLLLYEASGGTIGTKPEGNAEAMTFGERRGLLDSLIKIASLEQKDADDGPEVSGMDLIRKQMAKEKENGSRAGRGTRDIGGASESSADGSGADYPASEDDTADRG